MTKSSSDKFMAKHLSRSYRHHKVHDGTGTHRGSLGSNRGDMWVGQGEGPTCQARLIHMHCCRGSLIGFLRRALPKSPPIITPFQEKGKQKSPATPTPALSLTCSTPPPPCSSQGIFESLGFAHPWRTSRRRRRRQLCARGGRRGGSRGGRLRTRASSSR